VIYVYGADKRLVSCWWNHHACAVTVAAERDWLQARQMATGGGKTKAKKGTGKAKGKGKGSK